MSDQSNPANYSATAGVELRKMLVPYDHAATVAALQTGVLGNTKPLSQAKYVRAPDASGPQGFSGRPVATQRNNR